MNKDPQTTNKYFDNEVCDRLAEAGTFAGNHGMKITLDGLGITVERPKKHAPQLIVKRRVGYLDFSESRINVLLELCKELTQ